jgi:NADH-quinone oxidoreductase subunit G
MGVVPEPEGLAAAIKGKKAAYVVAADLLGDDPVLAKAVAKIDFLVVQELFLTETAKAAHVVLPAQSFAEREGTYTNAMRRIQRFYPAVAPTDGVRADWEIIAAVANELGFDLGRPSAASLMEDIAAAMTDYADITYPALSESVPQWPPVGAKDLYFSGTAFANHQGVGVQLAPRAADGKDIDIEWASPPKPVGKSGYMIVPITKLLDHGTTIVPSQVLAPRLEPLRVYVNPADAKRLKIQDAGQVEVRWNGTKQRLPAAIEKNAPKGFVLLPRSLGVPLEAATAVEIRPIGR